MFSNQTYCLMCLLPFCLLFVLSPVEGGRCAVIADGFGVGELVAHEVGAGGEGEEEEEEAGGRDHCGQGRGSVI